MTYHITTDFEKLIGPSRLESFNQHPNTVYGLDSKLNIAYLNPAWFVFADTNSDSSITDEWTLGKNIFESIPEVLQPFYRDLFESALNDNTFSTKLRQSEYECSSPELYRRFSMHLYPMGKVGLVAVHSLLVEEPYMTPPINGILPLDEKQYIDKNGIIHQCANCRRIHNLSHQERWDWIPKWVNKPHPRTSHGICPLCLQHYYLGEL